MKDFDEEMKNYVALMTIKERQAHLNKMEGAFAAVPGLGIKLNAVRKKLETQVKKESIAMTKAEADFKNYVSGFLTAQYELCANDDQRKEFLREEKQKIQDRLNTSREAGKGKLIRYREWYALDTTDKKYAMCHAGLKILKHINEEISRLEQCPPDTRKKLNWLGTPSQFGFILCKLAEKGFIEHPGDQNYSLYADICLELFDFDLGTTKQTLAKALNPDANQLADANRNKFNIPDIRELSPSKKRQQK